MFSISVQLKKLSLFLLIPMLSACVEGGPGPGSGGYYPPPRPQPQMCTMEYRPVCGERGGRFETFSNGCQADARGYRIVSPGECRGPGPGTYPPPGRPDRPDWNQPGRPDRPDWGRPGRPDGNGRPDRPDWDRPSRPDRPDKPSRPDRPEPAGGVCTREYRPVCGERGGRTQTFSNSCEARNAGFGIVSSGECRR